MYYSANWQLLEERIDDDSPFTPDPGSADIDRHVQHVWGSRYIDDVILHREDAGGDGSYKKTFYHLTDVQFSTVAVIDDTADLSERVTYTAYGEARHHYMADVDGDGDVESDDLYAIRGTVNGPNHAIGQANYDVDQDVDRDGDVTFTDYNLARAKGTISALALGLISDPAVDNQIGWDGYVFNTETLQYTVRFRCYDPVLGRWLERDPAGYFLGMSLYVYVRSGPLRFVDPWGLEEEDLPEGVKEISPSECWEDWKRKHKGFTDRELKSIHRIFQTGCIGITMINTGDPADPDLQNCYATVDKALKRQKEMQENCECKGKNNWQGDPSKPVIFFTDFLVKSANPICSDPDPNTGRIKFKGRAIPRAV